MGKILACSLAGTCQTDVDRDSAPEPPFTSPSLAVFSQKAAEPAVIEIDGRRNSLERCMLKFADYEKHTIYDEERAVYTCSIYYDIQDETELLIDLLSFGPVIRVLEPERLVQESLSNSRTVKLYHQQEELLARFDQMNGALCATSVKAQICAGLLSPLVNMVNNLGFA